MSGIVLHISDNKTEFTGTCTGWPFVYEKVKAHLIQLGLELVEIETIYTVNSTSHVWGKCKPTEEVKP